MSNTQLKKVCVYCASSRQANPVYQQDAKRLGEILAKNSITIVYGGGAVGSMGALAEGAIYFGGKVVGIIPRFMVDLEWANKKISDLDIESKIYAPGFVDDIKPFLKSTDLLIIPSMDCM